MSGFDYRRKKIAPIGFMTLKSVAEDCCTDETLMEIYYLKKNYRGQDRYEVEPYEIKDGALWAFDPNADTIKRFSLGGIVQVANTHKKWEVDPEHKRNTFERKLSRRNDERQITDKSE